MFLNQVIVVLLELDTLLTCILFNDQIRMGPSYAVPANDSPHDFSDDEDQYVHPLALPGAKSKKKAYNVYWGRVTGTFTSWSSAESQVKYFSGACYEGFTSVEDAVVAWDFAVASNAIGPPRAGAPRRHHRNLQPSTPPRSVNTIPSFSPVSTPSRGGSSTLVGPSNTSLHGLSSMPSLPASQTTSPTRSRHASAITSPPSTSVRPAAHAGGSALTPSSPSSLSVDSPATPSSRRPAAHAGGSALTPSSPSSLSVDPPATPSSRRPAAHAGGSALTPSSPSSLSVDPPATPSSRGSAARLTSITAALEGLNIDAYYVVVRGCKPGVYTSSSAALAATGSGIRALCCVVATRELANARFVEHVMAGDVEYIL